MLSSHSTQTKDPSLFALCGPGANATGGLPSGAGADEGDADFGALIDILQPAEPDAETGSESLLGELGAAGVAALGLAVPPPPLTFELPGAPVAVVEGIRENPGTPDGEGDALAEGGTSATGRHSEGADLGFGGLAGESKPGLGVGREGATAIVPGRATAVRPDAEDRTHPTPRFTGLPTSALEHRQARQLPPGLTPWRGMPVEPTEPSATESGPTLTGNPATNGSPVPARPLPEPARAWSGAFAGEPADLPAGRGLALGTPPAAAAAAGAADGRPATDQAALPPTWSMGVRPPPPRSEEKFAAHRESASGESEIAVEAGNKSFLAVKEELLAKHQAKLGTDGAKSGAAMPNATLTPSPHSPGTDFAVLPGVATVTDVAPPAEMSDRFSTAHEAVEVVLHAVEHVASREQKSVQLKFSVAGEELAVRVELRSDEVRTTFRTDSAELRSALAHEWQMVSGGTTPAERPVRLAPAVFVAAEQSALNAFAGDTSSRGRQAGARQDENARAVAGLRGRRAVAATHLPPSAAVAAPAWSSATHRLHTLA